MKNITSCAADGAPNIMGNKNGCLKLMKDVNPEMILVHCVIHRENLVAKNISPVLNEALHSIRKCVNAIKYDGYRKENAWKGTVMELLDTRSEILSDKAEMQ